MPDDPISLIRNGRLSMKAVLLALAGVLLAAGVHGCVTSGEEAVRLRYVGSSTIAHFIREADAQYDARFVIDTKPESAGGELAILEGRTDLAGVAMRPAAATLEAGVRATAIGRDAIAVVVHPSNPVDDLDRDQLAAIFTGRIDSWREVGGPDLAIERFIVGPASATRRVFRSAILGEADYVRCAVVEPDAEVLARVSEREGAIGQISFSFLGSPGSRSVKPISIGGQVPSPTNSDYPLARPLYLLSWPGRASVDSFLRWLETDEAHQILLRHFALPGDRTRFTTGVR